MNRRKRNCSSLLTPPGHESQHLACDCKTVNSLFGCSYLIYSTTFWCAERELRRSWGFLPRCSSRCSRWNIAGTTQRCSAQTLQSSECWTSAMKFKKMICDLRWVRKSIFTAVRFFQATPGQNGNFLYFITYTCVNNDFLQKNSVYNNFLQWNLWLGISSVADFN